jgi:hypothetical protein
MAAHSNQTSPARARWELSREAFDRLLDTLDPDRDAASRKYEALRRRLIDVFAWARSDAPEELADEALNRLARRLLEGVSLDAADVQRYASGIARLLLYEENRSRRNRDAALRDAARQDTPVEPPDTLHWLEECLDALPRESRELIERYYSEDREALARSLDLSVNALRNRAMRVRERLYDCVLRKRDV